MATLINVRLTQSHTHKGTRYAPGTILPLPEAVARWLVEQNTAQWIGAAAADAKPPPTAAASRRGGCCGWR